MDHLGYFETQINIFMDIAKKLANENCYSGALKHIDEADSLMAAIPNYLTPKFKEKYSREKEKISSNLYKSAALDELNNAKNLFHQKKFHEMDSAICLANNYSKKVNLDLSSEFALLNNARKTNISLDGINKNYKMDSGPLDVIYTN